MRELLVLALLRSNQANSVLLRALGVGMRRCLSTYCPAGLLSRVQREQAGDNGPALISRNPDARALCSTCPGRRSAQLEGRGVIPALSPADPFREGPLGTHSVARRQAPWSIKRKHKIRTPHCTRRNPVRRGNPAVLMPPPAAWTGAACRADIVRSAPPPPMAPRPERAATAARESRRANGSPSHP